MLLDLLNILQTYAKCYIVIYWQRLFTIILYVCYIFVLFGTLQVPWNVCKLEDNVQELVLFHNVGLRAWLQVPLYTEPYF